MKKHMATFAIFMLLAVPAICQEDGYELFYVPKGPKTTYNLGPTGIWAYGPLSKHIKHYQKLKDPGVFIVDRAEVGSPAHGLVRSSDVITGANGKPFDKSKDIRYSMAFAIEDSEATDGKLQLSILRGGKPITVTIRLEKIGAWSPTWPFDCDRTTAILTDACDFLQREQMPEGDIVADDGYIGPLHAGLLWLAMGEPRYLQNAIRAAYWYKDLAESGKSGYCWTQGYGGLLLAEYYNMTGDKNILPGLENVARILAKGQMPSGGWSHGGYSGYGAGYGEVNCAGMVCYMALLEAREIGVKVDHRAIAKAERYFEKFAPTQSNAYGDHYVAYGRKFGYGGSNGKVGGVSVAHRLNHKTEYADLYAIKGARSADMLEGGHTGHFFNMMWTPIAASQGPAKEYRSLMDQLSWYFTMARTWRGGFYCSPKGGTKYSTEGGVNMTTGGYGLVFAAPRRHLRILGAPVSVFARKDLPAALASARDLHQSRKWDAAIAAVDVFLQTGGHDKETLRLANELRDKSTYVKLGVDQAYKKLLELASGAERGPRMGSRPFKVTEIMKQMRQFLGKDDPQLLAIEKMLPEKFRAIWRHDKSYHEVFRKLRMFNTRPWFIMDSLVRTVIPDFAMPADSPAWKTIAAIPKKGGDWKTTIVAENSQEPTGWTKLDFDDSTWKGAEDSKWGQSKKLYLVRLPFELESTTVKQMRFKSTAGSLAPGTKVYLNGECILNSYTAIYREKVTLLENSKHLLRKGKNVLAYSTLSKGVPKGGALDVEPKLVSTFPWTGVPGRDSEIRKLVAQRRTPKPYYNPVTDQRTPKELMAVFTAEPFFMPEVYSALKRFDEVVPKFEDRTPYAKRLLESASSGAHLSGLLLVNLAMTSRDPKELTHLSSEQQAAIMAYDKSKAPAGRSWAKQFGPLVIKMLEDPYPQVRCQAAEMVKRIGLEDKGAVTAMKKLVLDVDGQNWFIRKAALDALTNMPVEEKIREFVIPAALRDPASNVRAAALGATLNSKDPAVKQASVQTYKKEMIEQIFDAPHGMFTRATRSQMAKLMLENLSKDEIRPYLPRFFESMKRPTGHQLKGSIAVLVSFGDEVRPKLEEMAKDDNLTVRFNAIEALMQMSSKEELTPEKTAFLKTQIKPLLTMKDWYYGSNKGSQARKWLGKLETGK